MNNRILETLEFEKVKQMVKQFVVTAQGKEELAELVPVSEKQTITEWLQETEDGLKVQRLRGGFRYENLKISASYETDRNRGRFEWSGACTSFQSVIYDK